MLSFSLALIGIDTLLLKYDLISWLDAIKASAILASLIKLIDLAMGLIFGGHSTGGI